MCGIAGFLVAPGALTLDESRQIATRMADRIRHRGPDAGGCWSDPSAGVALSHRRLSIIDLSPAGAQPMASADGRWLISFNGEIYNFLDLRADLEAVGTAFHGHSDTEVLLAAVNAWGLERALERANGMFAFALWDRQERRLVLARDRAGEKPLYFGPATGGGWVFGSELKALRQFPGFEPPVDRGALALFLRHGYVPAPWSIYQGTRKSTAGTPRSKPTGRRPRSGSEGLGSPSAARPTRPGNAWRRCFETRCASACTPTFRSAPFSPAGSTPRRWWP
jgi:asparagine synthase (glutamine-hydrolysing)